MTKESNSPTTCIYEAAEKTLIADKRAEVLAKNFPLTVLDLDNTQKAKITSQAERIGAPIDAFILEVLSNPNFYLTVVGAASSRQNYYETAFIKHIQTEGEVTSIQKLATDGPKSLYLNKGKLVEGGSGKGASKSLDLKVVLKDGQIAYITHKYTKSGGGSQDNQYADVRKSLDNYESENSNFILIANVDGAYYTKVNKSSGKSKIDILKADYETKGIYITTQYDFSSTMEEIAKASASS
jgi:hypothetical protein